MGAISTRIRKLGDWQTWAACGADAGWNLSGPCAGAAVAQLRRAHRHRNAAASYFDRHLHPVQLARYYMDTARRISGVPA